MRARGCLGARTGTRASSVLRGRLEPLRVYRQKEKARREASPLASVTAERLYKKHLFRELQHDVERRGAKKESRWKKFQVKLLRLSCWEKEKINSSCLFIQNIQLVGRQEPLNMKLKLFLTFTSCALIVSIMVVNRWSLADLNSSYLSLEVQEILDIKNDAVLGPALEQLLYGNSSRKIKKKDKKRDQVWQIMQRRLLSHCGF